MNNPIRQLVSDKHVSTPKGKAGMLDWVVAQVRAVIAWGILQLAHIQEFLDQIILGVADMLVPAMTEHAKSSTIFWTKIGTLLALGYVFFVKRKNAGKPEGTE